MIKLSNITKIFQQKGRTIKALDNVSLCVPAGQIYGVIGASGAGKSTLIRCVNLLERPTHGEVLVGDQDLMALSEAELTKARRQIGMIFQHFNLLASRTVFGNVALPLSWTPRQKRNYLPRQRTARTGGAIGQARCLPGKSVRRAKAARCDCSRAGQQS